MRKLRRVRGKAACERANTALGQVVPAQFQARQARAVCQSCNEAQQSIVSHRVAADVEFLQRAQLGYCGRQNLRAFVSEAVLGHVERAEVGQQLQQRRQGVSMLVS